VVIGSRKAFGNAAAEGLAVTELRSIDPKASEEMTSLYRYAFDIDKTPSGHLGDTSEIVGGK
jgi:chromosome partitioning protein